MRSVFLLLTTAFFIMSLSSTAKAFQGNKVEEIVLTGTVKVEEALSYRLIPFEVTSNTGLLEVSYTYTGKDEGNEIEIGLYDPNGFRGSSRFSKSEFVVGKYQATASYFPGDMPAGIWNISLAFPSIKQQADYEVRIRILPENHIEFTGPTSKPILQKERWYAGDFHTHTGHSDGFGCKDTNGNRTPCQVHQVAEAAHAKKLDFVAIADHNTVSHYQDIQVIQPNYPDLLLIRGQEVTTYFGHANVFGSGIPIDFRIGFEGQTFYDIQQELANTGAVLSINHPGRESGANCTGCGWTESTTDYSQLEVMEVINGTNIENEISGIPFWENLLNQGYRIIGIGGSDDHSAGSGTDQPGVPTTMVFAEELSESGILKALKKGKVYVDTRGLKESNFEFYAITDNSRWEMGEIIPLNEWSEKMISYHIIYSGTAEDEVEVIVNGQRIQLEKNIEITTEGNLHVHFDRKVSEREWIRINLRDKKGIKVLSNPIFTGWN